MTWSRRRAQAGLILALVTSGELTADVDSIFRLEQYAAALSRAEHYRRNRKVLFVFGD